MDLKHTLDFRHKLDLNKVLIGAAALVGAFMLYGLVKEASPEGQEMKKGRAAIDLCWREFDRRPASDNAGVAATCKKLEDRFSDTFGRSP